MPWLTWIGLAVPLRREFHSHPSLGRDVLWTAGETTGPDGQRMSLAERIAEIAARYGAEHAVTRYMTASAPTLAAAIVRVAARTGPAGADPVDVGRHREGRGSG